MRRVVGDLNSGAEWVLGTGGLLGGDLNSLIGSREGLQKRDKTSNL